MLDHFVLISALLVSIPLMIVGLECLAALWPQRRQHSSPALKLRSVVIVPAHNEATGIADTLAPLQRELSSSDTLVVIADNCTDNTAAVARTAGAMVFERLNPKKRGKGYALAFAIQQLQDDPPDIVVVVDADCQIKPGSLAKLAQVAALTGRPAQALYRFAAPPQSSHRDRLSAFAVLVRNIARPIGASRLGLNCLLQGSGMAFPWRVIQSAPLASGNLVEDMQLGIDLTLRGTPPILVEDAQVFGQLPSLEAGKRSQRTRWEHGHLSTLLSQAPRLLLLALRKRRFDLLALGLDLAVPPLALLTMMMTFVWFCALLNLVLAPSLAEGTSGLQILTAATALYLLGILGVAWRYGRDTISLRELLAVPRYLVWKLPIYLRFVHQREQRWIRTARDQ